MKSVALARTIRTGLAPSRSLQADPAPFEQIPRRPDSRRASRFDMIFRFFSAYSLQSLIRSGN